ncbi:MAG TPA: hypothetical protein VFH68_07995 [Polyangia bacterium]|nr:hypothetical protein [Polyangia bacterium]
MSVRRIALLLLLAALATALAGACHRRRGRDGTCVAHVDCDPGYDCVERRCRKRAAAPGTTPEAAPPRVAPVPSPPPGQPLPAETPETPPPARERPRRNPQPSSPPDNTPAPPPPDLPAWKVRLKNS